ncbi:hypothetical protein C5167_018219 [Papaver somniferum]|uniref:Uncharacterized protein n=1 Tax=Papaver somniferum TaxID=3469 RepID=A0A4Y7IPZ7_PAPSO|nr:hypothetical protein C5167_018219 [Papaver somniferum]
MAPRKQQLPNKEIDKQNCTTTGEVITLSDDEDQDVESLENLTRGSLQYKVNQRRDVTKGQVPAARIPISITTYQGAKAMVFMYPSNT